MRKRRIYFDHSATTPVHPEVFTEMKKFLTGQFGNASSIHSFGREAQEAVEQARNRVAQAIGAESREIFFTSGGTESDNMAIKGLARANREKGNHIITSAVEHHAVLDACEALKKEGFEITVVPVDENGTVLLDKLAEAVNDRTILISVMHANNEVGTIQPVKEIAALAKERGIVFHTDAVQSVGKIPVDVNEIGVDLLSISGHKIYGPKGIGALYIRRGVHIEPLLHGGGQERKRRPGTENVPSIVGLGKAVELVTKDLDKETERLAALRDRLIKEVQERIEDVKLNGHPENRVPNNINFSFKYIEGESLLLNLDLKGIAASTGSACSSGSLEPSHVLLAMGVPVELAHGSLRVTLGRDNTEEDVDYFLGVLEEVVGRLRKISPFKK